MILLFCFVISVLIRRTQKVTDSSPEEREIDDDELYDALMEKRENDNKEIVKFRGQFHCSLCPNRVLINEEDLKKHSDSKVSFLIIPTAIWVFLSSNWKGLVIYRIYQKWNVPNFCILHGSILYFLFAIIFWSSSTFSIFICHDWFHSMSIDSYTEPIYEPIYCSVISHTWSLHDMHYHRDQRNWFHSSICND